MMDLPSSAESASMDILNTVNHLWIATIDSDIANIPENEFATVFAGGIVSGFHGGEQNFKNIYPFLQQTES
jgi:hypothetical protein